MLRILFVLTLLSPLCLLGQSADPMVIEPGCFPPRAAPVEVYSTTWTALFYRGDSVYLKLTKLQINSCEHPDGPFLDTPPTQVTATDGSSACIALFSGLELTEGEVAEAEYPEELEPGHAYDVRLPGASYVLVVHARKEYEEMMGREMWTSYDLAIEDPGSGQALQSLLRIHELHNELPYIVWAGDLDGDSIPDLILNGNGRRGMQSCTLYLSGMAEDGEILHRAATFSYMAR